MWSVAWSPDGKLASGSFDKTVKIWVVDSPGIFNCESTFSIDWQSPDRESQILMVFSLLPLAMCLPSGLHATEKTLIL